MVAIRLGLFDSATILNCVCFCAFYCIKHMCWDGKAENLINIFDLEFAQPWILPIKALRNFTETAGDQFQCMISHIYVLNSSTAFVLGWASIRSFLDPLVCTKVSLVGRNTCKELQDAVHPDQLLKMYGGNAEQTQFWPPTVPVSPFNSECWGSSRL